MITPKITNLGYSNLWTDMSTILGYESTFDQQILKLFANGEQGFFYDPNDLSTMFQDAAGTVPVAGVGQAVGLIRDKSGRNNHAFQTESDSRPILRQNATTGANYLEFDGSDDFLRTNNIDFTGTDEVTVIAAIKVLSGTITSFIIELSNSLANNNSAFSIAHGSSNQLRSFSRGTLASTSGSGNSYPSPQNLVISSKMSISQDLNTLKVNTDNYTSVEDQGTGNYGNYPLYIGRRGGTTFSFHGQIYGLIGVGKLVSDSETTAIEKELAKRTGVTLNV